MKDEPLDFLPIVVLLGIVIPICFSLSLKFLSVANTAYATETYDKTIQLVKGETNYKYTALSVDLTFEEAVLMAASQSYFMPTPRVIEIGEDVYQIQSASTEMVDPNEAYTASETKEYIPGGRATTNNLTDSVRKWCLNYKSQHSSIMSGKEAFKFSFNYVFSNGSKEGAFDDCYTLSVACYNSKGEKEYLQCGISGGKTVLRDFNRTIIPDSAISFVTYNSDEKAKYNLNTGSGRYYIIYNERGT